MFPGTTLCASLPRRLLLAGGAVLVAVLADAGPAHSRGPECQGALAGELAAAQSDPQYPALQQAVDAYLRERGAAEHISGVSLYVSRAADLPRHAVPDRQHHQELH